MRPTRSTDVVDEPRTEVIRERQGQVFPNLLKPYHRIPMTKIERIGDGLSQPFVDTFFFLVLLGPRD